MNILYFDVYNKYFLSIIKRSCGKEAIFLSKALILNDIFGVVNFDTSTTLLNSLMFSP
jgi:hypothetical protein